MKLPVKAYIPLRKTLSWTIESIVYPEPTQLIHLANVVFRKSITL